MINVTKTFLPEREEYLQIINPLWKSLWITNNGEILKTLEKRLTDYLGVQHLDMVGNGTLALQFAIRSLDLGKEVITTPFSYVATTSSLIWENCTPVFCDIDEATLNINSESIESLITNKTTAILATHVYGNPCKVEQIHKIARENNLKVIYDASHCFGVKYKNQSILNYGDISTLSFHATKVFHTVEGGATVTKSPNLSYRIGQLRNFGHKGYEQFDGIGINGKQSEFHAAMGMCVLDNMDFIFKHRKRAFEYYNERLNLGKIRKPELSKHIEYNYSYYPIVLPSENDLLKLKLELENQDIFPRRYFYPLLNKLGYLSQLRKISLPVAENLAQRVLCLPLHHDLNADDLERICLTVNKYD